MRRDGERSRIVFPGLLVLALLLFCVPETAVDAARARALSALRPILSRCAAWRAPEPQLALISVDAPQPAAADKPAPKLAIDPAEVDRLRSYTVWLESELKRLQGSQIFPNLPTNPPTGIIASIIERRILWQEPLFAIDKGFEDGVRMHAGVLHRGAVIGRVVAVGPHAASLALLSHRAMTIAARLSDCRIEGDLTGFKEENGERFCKMSIVAREAAPKIGENVVTSGYDGAFPPGLWMGQVTTIKKTADFQWELTVRPACNDNAVEIVEVLNCALPEVPWPIAPKGKKADGRKQ